MPISAVQTLWVTINLPPLGSLPAAAGLLVFKET
jgi:hypothetical protein